MTQRHIKEDAFKHMKSADKNIIDTLNCIACIFLAYDSKNENINTGYWRTLKKTGNHVFIKNNKVEKGPKIALKKLNCGELFKKRGVPEECIAIFPDIDKSNLKESLDVLRGKDLLNVTENIIAQINKAQADKIKSNAAEKKSTNNGFPENVHRTVIKQIFKIWERSGLIARYLDQRSNDKKTFIERYVSLIRLKEKDFFGLLTIKHSQQGRRIYSCELMENTQLDSFIENLNKQLEIIYKNSNIKNKCLTINEVIQKIISKFYGLDSNEYINYDSLLAVSGYMVDYALDGSISRVRSFSKDNLKIQDKIDAANHVSTVIGYVNPNNFDSADDIYLHALASLGIIIQEYQKNQAQILFNSYLGVTVNQKNMQKLYTGPFAGLNNIRI